MVLIYIKATPVRTVATGKSPLSYLATLNLPILTLALKYNACVGSLVYIIAWSYYISAGVGSAVAASNL